MPSGLKNAAGSAVAEVELPQPGGAGCGTLLEGLEALCQASLTLSNRVDTLLSERSSFGENRGINRILRRLKLHAEGRQFGG
jgi:hypothetical protein